MIKPCLSLLRHSRLALPVLLVACSSLPRAPARPAAVEAPQDGPASTSPNVMEHSLQVLENGRVSVQLRTDSLASCQKQRQDMLAAAEKTSPGKGSKALGPNLICAFKARALPYSLQVQNYDYQFATREGCEHYAILKGLYPPKPAPGTPSPCIPAK